MKQIIAPIQRLWMIILFSCFQFAAFSQETSATEIKHDAKHFLSQPWVWAVGGVLLLILLIAMFSGGSKKHKQIVKTTVIKEEEVV